MRQAAVSCRVQRGGEDECGGHAYLGPVADHVQLAPAEDARPVRCRRGGLEGQARGGHAGGERPREPAMGSLAREELGRTVLPTWRVTVRVRRT